uniref:RRM domain-containing protein n=1 Tax=Kalanchoe fedtschenkoi TaxID=63787 RepID=A0A7N0UFG8_KALFE
MNSVEPSAVVYQRLSSLDPESASKIMGFILIHGPSEGDMMSLAVAPDAVLQQLIEKGKNYSRILAATPSALHSPTPRSSVPAPRFPVNGFVGGVQGSNLSSPRQIPAVSTNPSSLSSKASPSYAAVVNGNGPLSSPSSSSSSQFHHNDCDGGDGGVGEEEYAVPEALSFLNDQSKAEDVYDLGAGSPRSFHKRSLSLSDAYAGGGAVGGSEEMNGKFDGFEQEMLRSRATQQQRLALASQIMAGSSLPYSKYLTDSPRSMAAAMMMGEELHKLGQLRHDRGDFSLMGCSSGSRQIYLTFPADSTFREEDVSNYFSLYGPVQDVRIPYQQKRMFGFVTFVHPETVKIILAKGNPHFVCDSRVLVKPYKEKGKVEKKHLMTQQQMERGDLSSCSSPHGVDIRDFDVRVGPRMFYNNTQDLLMRRKLEEQAEFQQALEMQSRKLASLQLLDLKNLPRRHPFSPSHNLSPAGAVSSPTHPLLSPNHMRSMGVFNQDAFEENITTPTLSLPPHALANRQTSLEGFSNVNNCNEYMTSNTNEMCKLADSADNESIELVLPDTLDDTTPARSAPSRQSIFSSAMLALNENAASSSPQFTSSTSTIVSSSACLSNVALPKSRFLEDPSFGSAGNRAIEM